MSGLLALGLLAVVAIAGPRAARTARGGRRREVEALGRLLFTDYLFPFELTSVLLLAAMVGVLLLARRRPEAVAWCPSPSTWRCPSCSSRSA